MKVEKVIIVVIIILSLVVDWLTFHDIAQPHSVRDWFTLIMSVLVFFYFIKRAYEPRKNNS